MAQFQKGNKASTGRPRGSLNKKTIITDAITAEAVKQLELSVAQGDAWSISEVLRRVSPPLKPVTPVDSLDGKILQAKLLEMTELEQRIKALEANA